MLKRKPPSYSTIERRFGFIFLSPALLFLTIFILIPIIYTTYMSLYDWSIFDLGRNREFVGLDNYRRAFTDPVFGDVLRNTGTLVFFSLAIQLVIGTFVSLCLWNIKRKLKILHSIILLPMITAPVIVALMWRYIYDPIFGILNFFLETVGVGRFSWLGTMELALPSIIVVDIWQMTPFIILVLFAGLTVLPIENVEASSIDGASYLQMARHIIIPFLSPLILLIIIIRMMDLVRIFDVVYLLTRGGPGSSTEMLATYTYRIGFSNHDMGYASTLSILTLVIIFIISFGFMLAMNRKSDSR